MSFQSPNLIAAVILLSKVSGYNLCPSRGDNGSILCNISVRGLADLYLNFRVD